MQKRGVVSSAFFLIHFTKKTEGYKSGSENQTARLHATKQRVHAYDEKAKCDHAARAQMARDRRREDRRNPISNKSDEYRHFFANLFSGRIHGEDAGRNHQQVAYIHFV